MNDVGEDNLFIHLANNGKMIVYMLAKQIQKLPGGITRNCDVILRKHSFVKYTHSSGSAIYFCVLALYFLGLATHYHES